MIRSEHDLTVASASSAPPPAILIAGTARDDVFDFSRDRGVNYDVRTGEGDDFVFASSGNDTISGGFDNDALFGNDGNDSIVGDQGDDFLAGGRGADTLSGGAGDDTIVFGIGDMVRGGPGADRFIFHIDSGGGEHGMARVLDFHPDEGDIFYFDNPAEGDSYFETPTMTILSGTDSENAIVVTGVGWDSYDFLGGKG